MRLKSQGHDFHRETYTISTADESFELKAGISPIYWANVLGLIGFAVDYATGAMWSLPAHIDVENFEQADMLPDDAVADEKAEIHSRIEVQILVEQFGAVGVGHPPNLCREDPCA